MDPHEIEPSARLSTSLVELTPSSHGCGTHVVRYFKGAEERILLSVDSDDEIQIIELVCLPSNQDHHFRSPDCLWITDAEKRVRTHKTLNCY